MAWQKNKVLLMSVVTDENGKKHVSRYETQKSKGKGKPNQGKMELMKMHKILRKHTLHKETKFK
jgi:ribosomal protein L33